MSEKFAFNLQKVSKLYPPNKQVLKDINLSFYYGAKIGILGLNGTGKSTLLKIIAGVEKDYTGEATWEKNYSVGYLPQEPVLDATKTVKENVLLAFKEIVSLLDEYEKVSAGFSDPDLDDQNMQELIDKQAKLQEKIEQNDGWELEHKISFAMDALRLPPGDSEVTNLSGGEKRRVALCQLLLQNPDILLLDEPTNHLDAESVYWLEHFLSKYPGTVLAITHDRYFLDNTAGWILELDRGRGFPFKGNYSSWLEQKQTRLAHEEKEVSKRQKTLKRELEWIRMAPKARQSKGKARISAYESLASEQGPEKIKDLEIYIPPGPRLGDIVVKTENLTKAFGDKLLFENLSIEIPRGSIVGIVGGNGAGKTSLFRLITGEEKPDAGSITVGETVELGYVDQSREALDANKTVWEEISEGLEIIKLGAHEMQSRAYCGRFNFAGQDQQKKIGDLSGGERNRVHLAKLLKKGSNVLLLDEPTNDLDVNTLRALEEAILNFAGSVLVISHDRWFLDRICTHIIAFEGDSQVVFHEGNYQDYEDDKKKRLGAEALIPKRLKYRKLSA